MKCDPNILSELHREGFKRLWSDRHKDGDSVCYIKEIGDRKLDLQLWEDGNHRVSHWINGFTKHGRMCTPPTYFSTVKEMRVAIQCELARTDHPEPL